MKVHKHAYETNLQYSKASTSRTTKYITLMKQQVLCMLL